jgi:hypothetical protein
MNDEFNHDCQGIFWSLVCYQCGLLQELLQDILQFVSFSVLVEVLKISLSLL